MNRSPIVMATGGSGGHIYPAIAVAQVLAAKGHDVSFIGQQGGMEEHLVPDAGFSFQGVRAGKWHRGKPDPRQAVRALMGLFEAHSILKQLRPSTVVGFGGFASFPALAAATRLKVPIVLHEGNAFPGRVVRWFAKRAALVALTYAETERYLPQVKQFAQVGFPIREARLAKAEARRQLGLPPEDLVTLVMGGSQGSLVLNDHVPKAYEALPEAQRQGHTVFHSSGPRWLERVGSALSSPARYRVEAYVDATLAWSAADVAITRAGNSTLAEAAFFGVPLIMVPLPSAAENHQHHNALAVSAAGAGRLVLESELANLTQAWADMLQDEVRLPAAAAASRRSPAGAARVLAGLIEEVAHGRVITKCPRQGARSQEST